MFRIFDLWRFDAALENYSVLSKKGKMKLGKRNCVATILKICGDASSFPFAEKNIREKKTAKVLGCMFQKERNKRRRRRRVSSRYWQSESARSCSPPIAPGCGQCQGRYDVFTLSLYLLTTLLTFFPFRRFKFKRERHAIVFSFVYLIFSRRGQEVRSEYIRKRIRCLRNQRRTE